MSERPAVSIVMPAFHSERFIEAAIASVCVQSFTDWELLVVDDDSRDGTTPAARQALHAYGKYDQARLFLNPQRLGPAKTRNRAITEARGRWIAFLDSDDLWTPDKLEKQLPLFDDAHTRLACGGFLVIDDQGLATGEQRLPPPRATYTDMLEMNTVGCLTAIYDTERAGKVFMPDIPRRQDYGLWLSLIRPEGSVVGLQSVVGKYRRHAGSISSNKLAVAYWQWILYREQEHLSVPRSLGCLWNHFRRKTEVPLG
jgi:glycosyltransferase involved in cell wall biosynthesis